MRTANGLWLIRKSRMATLILEPIWVGAMKTTIEISDSLLRQARKLAEREGITLRAVVERGLHRVVEERKPAAPFRLRRASFRGEGLQKDVRGASWDTLRDLVYRDRGG